MKGTGDMARMNGKRLVVCSAFLFLVGWWAVAAERLDEQAYVAPKVQYALRGRVHSEAPISAMVSLVDAGTGLEVGMAVTDVAGDFVFSAVDVGTYDLVVVPPADTGYPEVAVAGISISDRDVFEDIFMLASDFVVSGTVYSANGTPVEGMRVFALAGGGAEPDGGGYSAMTVSDIAGQYEVRLPAGTYQIMAEYVADDYVAKDATAFLKTARAAKQAVALAGGLNIATADFLMVSSTVTVTGSATHDIVLPPFTTVSGQVLINGAAVPDARVAFEGGGSADDAGVTTTILSGGSVEAPDGSYALLLAPGTYSVMAVGRSGTGYVEAWIGDVNLPWNAAGADGTLGFDIELSLPYVITGTAYAADAATKVSGLWVKTSGWAYTGNASQYLTLYSFTAQTDGAGRYTMPVVGGTYDLAAGYANDVPADLVPDAALNIVAPEAFEVSPIVASLAVVAGSVTADVTLPA